MKEPKFKIGDIFIEEKPVYTYARNLKIDKIYKNYRGLGVFGYKCSLQFRNNEWMHHAAYKEDVLNNFPFSKKP